MKRKIFTMLLVSASLSSSLTESQFATECDSNWYQTGTLEKIVSKTKDNGDLLEETLISAYLTFDKSSNLEINKEDDNVIDAISTEMENEIQVVGTSIHEPSGLTVDQFNDLINNLLDKKNIGETSKLRDPEIGKALYELENETGNINGLFVLGISSLESHYGTSSASYKRNNLMGVMQRYGNKYVLKTFDSPSQSIKEMGISLSKNYIQKGLQDLISIGKVYCPNNYRNWALEVDSLFNEFIYHTYDIIQYCQTN